jgi:tetratricopeptide (TPR) repeat protein
MRHPVLQDADQGRQKTDAGSSADATSRSRCAGSVSLNRSVRVLLPGFFLVLWSLWPSIPAHCNAADHEPDREASQLAALADEAYDQGRFVDAARGYSLALKKEPATASLYYRRAMAYEMLDRSSHAVTDYLKAIELDPRDFKAMENLGGMYERDGIHFVEAISLYKRARELDPRPVWKENLGVWIAMLESRVRGERSSPVAAWHLGNKKARNGDLKDALAHYTKAIESDPKMFQAFHSRALARVRMGDIPGALQDLDAAVELCPTLRGALVLRGLVRERMGDRAKALLDFRRATRVDPKDPQAHYELGRMLEEQMEPAEALREYEEALRVRPKPELRRMVQSRIAAVHSAPGPRNEGRSESPRILKEMW